MENSLNQTINTTQTKIQRAADGLAQSKDLLERIARYILIGVIFLTPLFFLPLTPNFYAFNKMYLVGYGSLAVLIILLLKNAVSKKVSFQTTPLDLPVFLFLIAMLASTFFSSPNRLLPLWGKTGIIIAFTLFYLALVQSAENKIRLWLQALFASSFVLSWFTIFAYTQVLGKIVPWEFVNSQFFNLTGNLIGFLVFQVILLPVVIIFALKSNQFLNKILYFVVAALMLVSSILVISLMMPGKPGYPIFLPYGVAWWIAVEIFKNAKTAFLGVGPENFLSAFTQFRPIAFNSNASLWNIRFTNSSNEFLQILTTVGVFGFATFCYLLFRGGKTLLKNLKKDNFNLALKISFAITVISFLLIPVNFLILFLLYIQIALIARQFSTQKTFNSSQLFKVGVGASAIAIIVLFYFSGRVWYAEAVFKQAMDAAAANKGLDTYNLGNKAIGLNKYQEKYRVSSSQINLALANSLASKENLTDQDKQNITQLVSQSIEEAKAAAALNPTNPIYWENLAGLYRSLINFAEGAENWTVSAYAQAVVTDPVNPVSRVDLGGLFYGFGNYDAAIDNFKRSIDLKPDFANAYYNLSWAYKQADNPVQAFSAMQNVLALVPQDSEDFIKAAQELEELRALLPEEYLQATASGQQQQLVPPQPLPSTPPSGPIDLPEEESAPEVSEETVQEATKAGEIEE